MAVVESRRSRAQRPRRVPASTLHRYHLACSATLVCERTTVAACSSRSCERRAIRFRIKYDLFR